jgi:hypothetical protein
MKPLKHMREDIDGMARALDVDTYSKKLRRLTHGADGSSAPISFSLPELKRLLSTSKNYRGIKISKEDFFIPRL